MPASKDSIEAIQVNPCSGLRLDLQPVVKDVFTGMAGEVEVGVLGHVDGCGAVSGGLKDGLQGATAQGVGDAGLHSAWVALSHNS